MPLFTPRVDGHISAGNSPSAQLPSPNCSPIRPRCTEHHPSPTGARRKLQFTAQAVPSGNLYSASPSVLSARDANSRARMDSLSVMDSAPAGATMGSSFRRLLTASHPDIQTLHSILVSLHRSEATPTDLHHASQAIGLLASVASDRNSCADCADMATAILSTLATYPKTRTQLPAHARRQLTDALIEIIGYNTTYSNPQPAIARQPGPRAALPDTPSSIHAGNLAQLPMNTFSALSNRSASLLSGAVLRRQGRSLSPRGISNAGDLVSPAARAASVPPTISESNLIRQSILASPGSPRRQLTSFAQRAIERLQEARQTAHAGTTNTSVPSFIPASQLGIPESLEAAQQKAMKAAHKGQIDSVTDAAQDSGVQKVLEFDSVPVPQLRKEQEELQESLPGSLGGAHAKASLPGSAARFLQAAVQDPGTSNTAERISTIALSSGQLVPPVNDSDSVGKSTVNCVQPALNRADGPTTAGAAAFLDSQKRTFGGGTTGVYTPEVSYRGPRPANAMSDGTSPNTVALWPSSLQDSDTEPAMVSALSLVLSKCGLARASVSGSSGDGASGGSVTVRSEQSARRNAEEEASLRRAGRWVLATLAVAAAATADDVVMTQLNSKRFTAMLSGWLDQGDNIQSTTAVLVSLALLEAKPKAAAATEAASLRSDSKESDRPAPIPFHSPPFIDTLATRCSSLITRHSSPFARTLAMRASAACGVVSTRTLRVSDSIDVDIGLRMHDYIVMGLSHLGVTSASAPCTHSLLAPLIPSFHGRGQAPTVAAAAATAVASISAGSVEDLERFVEAGAISGLTRGLASGYADEAAACAAALAVIARLPSAHSHLLRSGACDVILRCAGSRNKELQSAQPGIAAALAHLSCNNGMQFTLMGKGLAGAVCSLITNAPSACMPAVAKVIIAVAREGGMQGAILVRAGVVKELVGFLRRRLPCAHLRSAHASLHALLIHARSIAASEALAAGAIPHLLFALSSSDQKTRKRAARMLSLLLEASSTEASAILARLECAAPLMRLLRHGDFAERAEAVDLIYLLRGSTQVMRALGNDDGAALRSLAEILATCTPHHPHAQIRPRPPADITPWQVPPARTPSAAVPASPPATPAATAAAAAAAAEAAAAARAQQRRSAAVRHSGAQNNGIDESAGRLLFSSADGSGSGSSSGGGSWRWHWDADAPEHDGLTAAEVGLFSSSASIGARINTDAIRGKVVRVLCTMAIHPESRDAVASCSELADPLSRLLAHHRGLHNWSSMSQPSLPLPEPERTPLFLKSQSQASATQSRPANGALRADSSTTTNAAAHDSRYDADAEGDSSDSANKNDPASNPSPVVDVSDKVLERIRNMIEVGSESPPRIRRGLRLNSAEPPRMLSVPMSTTYEAAELLLSWLLDMRRLQPLEVLEPLCVQAWLGNNVDVIHSQRFNFGSSIDIDEPAEP